MARARRVLTGFHPYHVTARCINKDWFRLPLELVWKILSERLYFANHAFYTKIHSFVLMNNHFHLLITTPKSNLNHFMQYLMSEVSREITYYSGRINQTFGGPYYSSVIKNNFHFLHAYKYVYRNPVEAKLAENVESYTFSTLNGLLGKSHILIPVVEDRLLLANVNQTLEWLNTAYVKDYKEQVKSALRRAEFILPKNRISRKPSELEYEIS
ncbi:MAG: transposase [Oligoflexia bacterium]|nr:transposase [Oligoflexia bacterium]